MAHASIVGIRHSKLNPLQIYAQSKSGNIYRLNRETANPKSTAKLMHQIKQQGHINTKHWTKVVKTTSKAKANTAATDLTIYNVYSGKAFTPRPTAIATITSIYSGE